MPLPPAPLPERRARARAHLGPFDDYAFRAWRRAAGVVHGARRVLGLVLLAGAAVALAGTWAFVKVAGEVREGATQAVDEAVLRWVAAHRLTTPWHEAAVVELTSLGTAVVVMAVVGIAALFLALTRHRYSALLLVVSSAGGIALNSVLKLGFQRPRPTIVEWGTHAMSTSFPSGHAMSAAIAYGTVAWLAARLARRRLTRGLVLGIAVLLILAISASRVYLGVHYPSDVIAGLLVGLAWAGFCMAVLEALVLYGRGRAPVVLRDEEPPPPHEDERRVREGV